MKCVTCGRTYRPRRAAAELYPGTVAMGNRGECAGCTNKRTKRTVRHEPVPVTCARCGLTEMYTGGAVRRYELCRDCRSVLSREERVAWAA